VVSTANWIGGGNVVIAVTYAGVNLTNVATNAPLTAPIATMWRLAGASYDVILAGAHPVLVTMSAGIEIAAVASSWRGVDPTSPVGTPVTAAGDALNSPRAPSVTVASSAGEVVVSGVAVQCGGALLATGGTTLLASVQACNAKSGASQIAGGGNVVMSWTGLTDDRWAEIAVALHAVGGAPTPTPGPDRCCLGGTPPATPNPQGTCTTGGVASPYGASWIPR
jgi:hypothetical protein